MVSRETIDAHCENHKEHYKYTLWAEYGVLVMLKLVVYIVTAGL
jgi:hypothetical protein